MRAQDIKFGEYYRFKEHPNYGYFKVLKIYKPKQSPNSNDHIVVEGEHTVYKNDKMGFIRCFRPCDLIKETI
jgi:hypothetical protein